VLAQSQLTPLGKWCLRLAGLLAVLLIAVVVNYVAHGGTEGLNPVAEAAERTANMAGAKIAIEVKYSSSSSPTALVGNGSGVFDAHTGRTDVNISLPVPSGVPVFAEVVSTPQTVFVRGSGLEGELPPGKRWLEVEPLLAASEQTAFASNDSAQGTLEALGTVGSVDREDRQIVRGDLTTRYKSEIDPAKVVDVLKEKGEADLARAYEILAEKTPLGMGLEVWIDGKGLVRQITMTQQIPTTDGNEVTSETRMQFYDFGPQTGVKPPKRSQVFDYTPVLRAELGLEDGSALGPLTPPRGAKPLAAAPFRRRAIVICRRVEGEGVGLLQRSRALVREMKGLGPAQAEEGRQLVRKFARAIGEPLVQLSRRGTHELAGLDPPRSLAAEFHRYLLLDAKQVEWNLAQTRAYELGNVELPSLAGRKAEEPREKAERTEVATHLGLSRCEKAPRSEGQPEPAESSFE
jgi:hypothetical protein